MTEVAKVRDVAGDLARFMSVAKDVVPIDPQQAALDMVSRILGAGSVDEVLEGSSAIHAVDVLGQNLTIVGVRWNESDLADGAGFYALIDCVDNNGEGFAVTCGAITVMAQLFKLDELGALPGTFQLVEAAKPTKSGYKPMSLVKGEEQF